MNKRSPRRLIGTLALLVLFAGIATGAEAAYPGKPGPIAYLKYRDVSEIVDGLEVSHPEGGLLTHGPKAADEPRLLLDDPGAESPAYSPNGRLIAFTSTPAQEGARVQPHLFLMRSDGSSVQQLTNAPAGDSDPYFSPNGLELVFSRGDHLWLLTLGSGAKRQLTFGDHRDSEPVFTPSGRRIVFVSNRQARGGKDRSDIWAVGLDGRNARVLIKAPGTELSPDVSPDGRRIVFVSAQAEGGIGDLRLARSNGNRVHSLAPSGSRCEPCRCDPCFNDPAFAPDGRHLLAGADDEGRTNVYVMRVDGTKRKAFDTGAVEIEGNGTHVATPTWGPAIR
jgi:Tol biopolymer transport system component